jgi:hypothetical protein
LLEELEGDKFLLLCSFQRGDRDLNEDADAEEEAISEQEASDDAHAAQSKVRTRARTPGSRVHTCALSMNRAFLHWASAIAWNDIVYWCDVAVVQLILDAIAAIDEKVEVLTRVEEYARPIAAGGSTTLSLEDCRASLELARTKLNDAKLPVVYWKVVTEVRSVCTQLASPLECECGCVLWYYYALTEG